MDDRRTCFRRRVKWLSGLHTESSTSWNLRSRKEVWSRSEQGMNLNGILANYLPTSTNQFEHRDRNVSVRSHEQTGLYPIVQYPSHLPGSYSNTTPVDHSSTPMQIPYTQPPDKPRHACISYPVRAPLSHAPTIQPAGHTHNTTSVRSPFPCVCSYALNRN